MQKKICDCRGSSCHTGPQEPLYYVHFRSLVGGRGTHGYLSGECIKSRRKFVDIITSPT